MYFIVWNIYELHYLYFAIIKVKDTSNKERKNVCIFHNMHIIKLKILKELKNKIKIYTMWNYLIKRISSKMN